MYRYAVLESSLEAVRWLSRNSDLSFAIFSLEENWYISFKLETDKPDNLPGEIELMAVRDNVYIFIWKPMKEEWTSLQSTLRKDSRFHLI